MRLNQSASNYSVVLFVFTILMVGILLVWHTTTNHTGFINHQKEMARYAVIGVAKELSILLQERKRSLSRFVDEEYPLIQQLVRSPDNEQSLVALKNEMDIHIGDYISFTITDDKGRILYADPVYKIEGEQQQDIADFMNKKLDYDVYAYEGPEQCCLVSMVYYNMMNKQQGIFLVNFTPTVLARMLKNNRIPQHRLMLLHRDFPGLIEVADTDFDKSSLGQIKRQVITQQQMENIAHAVPIERTQWKLVDIPEEGFIESHMTKIWSQSLAIFIMFLLASTIIFWFAKNEERKRNRSEKKLGYVKEQLQAALDFSNTRTWELDLTTNSLNISDKLIPGFSGTSVKTLSDYFDVVHPDDRERLRTAIEGCKMTGIGFIVEHRIDAGDGSTHWLELTGNCNQDSYPETYTNKLIGLMRDIGDQKKAEQKRLTSLKQQRDTLVLEVHHRIKNNLQGVMALLRQSASYHPESREILEHAASQLHSVSLIYGLHSESSPGDILLSDLVAGICQATSQMTNHPVLAGLPGNIEYCVSLADDKATLIALILNELIINAVKHGENNNTQPINVNLAYENNKQAFIKIHNMGKIKSADFSFEDTIGLGTGLKLVSILLPRKGARLTIKQQRHEVVWTLELTMPTIRFKQDAHEPIQHSQ